MPDSQIWNEEHSESERSVEVEAQKTKCTEEPLHHQVCEITEDMESPECSARAEETAHEVDDDVKDELVQAGVELAQENFAWKFQFET